MTKIHKTKLALLGATAFFAATSAHAQVADTWTISDDVIVSSANTSTSTTLDPVTPGAVAGIEGALIEGGFKNSISGAAVGSSASSSFTSVNNSGNGAESGVTFQGVTVAAGNGSAVTNNTDFITGSTIAAGNSNSISLAAVGSSASAGGSVTITDVGGAAVGGDEVITYTAASLTVSSGDSGGDTEVDQGSTTGGNTGAVKLQLDSNGIVNPLISSGNGNSISVAGVGSSSSASFSATAGGDGSILDSFTIEVTDGGAISAANASTGTVSVGIVDVGFTTPTIEGGNGNSISAAAVGSSASFSLASSTFDSGVITEFNANVGDLAVDSTNNGATTLSADGVADSSTAIGTALIGGGNGNSISASAVGSSGSVSYSNTVFDGANGTAGGTVTFASITVNSTNNAVVNNATDLTTSGGIDGGSKNSISIAGVGASASQSLSVTDYSGGGITAVATTTGGITLTAFNTANVGVSGGLQVPSIADGFSNSISAAAVGASASQSVSRTLVGAQ